MSREWGYNLTERRWSLIKQLDWIVDSSLSSVRGFLFRVNPFSTEICPWLIEKITCKIMHISLKKKSSNLSLLGLKAWIFSGSVLKQVWMKEKNCGKALSLVVADDTFKNVKCFSSSFTNLMALLESKWFGSRHLACFTIMEPSGLLSNIFFSSSYPKLQKLFLKLRNFCISHKIFSYHVRYSKSSCIPNIQLTSIKKVLLFH